MNHKRSSIIGIVIVLGVIGAALLLLRFNDKPTTGISGNGDEVHIVSRPLPPLLPSLFPYETPFIEMSGSRIRQKVAVSLDGSTASGMAVSTVQEHQVIEVNWSVDPSLETRITYLGLSVQPVDRSAPRGWEFIGAAPDLRSLRYGFRPERMRSDAVDRGVVPILPGEYDIAVSAYEGPSPPADAPAPIASATTRIRIEPMSVRIVDVEDILADGTIRYTTVQQHFNTGQEALWRGSFGVSAETQVEKVLDENGMQMEITREETAGARQVRYRFRQFQPSLPGQPMLRAHLGTKVGLVQQLSNGQFVYNMTRVAGMREPTHRLGVYRLPVAATDITTDPTDMKRQVIDGQVHLLFERTLHSGEAQPISIRWRQ